MKIEEITRIKVTFPGAKIRAQCGWNLEKNTELRQAIERVLATGKAEILDEDRTIRYHIRPEYPLIESAMAKPENRSLQKVSIVVHTMAFTLGVRSDG